MKDKIDETKLPPVPDEPETTSFYGPEKESGEMKKKMEGEDKNKSDE